MHKKINWHKLADSRAELLLQANGMGIVQVAGRKLTVALFNNSLFAFAYKCPHASGIMADGFLDAAGNVVCPLHRYKFNLQNGRNTSGEGYYLKTYPIEERDNGLYLGIEEQGLFSRLF